MSSINEDDIKKKTNIKNFSQLAKKLAEEKALSVSRTIKNTYVIGADQICVKQNKAFSKPKFKKKAIEQLCLLNGKTHKQISSVCITFNEKIIWSYIEIAKMKMRKLPISTLKEYVEIDLPLQSCGSYKFEANGKYLFSNIDGDINTIIGLPIFALLKKLHEKKIIAYA